MSSSLRRFLPVALLLSGASSLVLEVAWSRSLSLTLGNSHQAVATVVASMMAGLWAGSAGAARLLPRVRNAAAWYGLTEIFIGSYAALTPLIFAVLPVLLAPVYGPNSTLFATVRFAVVFTVLLPASAAMGATLPLAGAALSRSADDGVAGWVYGLNTLGAFLGTLLGGFVLLPNLGLFRTILAAAVAGGVVGFSVWVVARRLATAPAEAAGASSRDSSPAERVGGSDIAWVLPLYACSGAVAMIYEITWTRALAPIVGTSVYSFTLILAAVLAGIGLGSLLFSTRAGGRVDPARGFVVGQLLLSVTAFLTVWGLGRFPDLLASVAARDRLRPWWFLLNEFALLLLVIVVPALILGTLFPLAVRLVPRSGRPAGTALGRAYAWNTAGSIGGALAAGFVFVVTLGTRRTLVLAAAGSAIIALCAVPLTRGVRFRAACVVASVVLAVSFPFLAPEWDVYRMTRGITETLRGVTESGPSTQPEGEERVTRAARPRVVFHREGRTSTVTVVRQRSENWLRVDGKTDASTTTTDMLTQVLLGQVPFLFARNPEDVCVIGLGSGVTTHAVLTHPVRRVDTIEIEAQIVAASALFEPVSLRPLKDPRSHLIVDDARTALLYGPRMYDVIISEPSNPWIAGVNNLFTVEFYQLVRRRLKPGGVFCQWVQFYEMSGESLLSTFQGLASVFPHAHLLASNMGGDMLLLASDRPFEPAPGAASLFPDQPAVALDFARVGMQELADLALLYTGPLLPVPAGARLNTDDNSLLQYRTPFDMFLPSEPQLMGVTPSPESVPALFFPGAPERDAFAALGRAAYRREAEQTLSAIGGYLEYKGYVPEASEMRRLFEELEARLQKRSQANTWIAEAENRADAADTPGAIAMLEQAESAGFDQPEQCISAGFVWLRAGRPADAERCFGRGFPHPGARNAYEQLAGRGASRLALGRRREGIADLDAAKAIDPDRSLAYGLLAHALAGAGEIDAALHEVREGIDRNPESDILRRQLVLLASRNSPAGEAPLPQPSPRWE